MKAFNAIINLFLEYTNVTDESKQAIQLKISIEDKEEYDDY